MKAARLARLVPRRPTHRTLVVLLTFALVALFAPRDASAQGVVTGSVQDAETGQPVAEDLGRSHHGGRERVASVRCDAEGRFEITGAPAGSYSLVFSRLGYDIRRIDGVTVGTAPTDVGSVTLVSRALRMNPVVVTPSRTEEKALRAPASTWVVTTQDIESRPATSSVEHVRDVPGVDVATTGLSSTAWSPVASTTSSRDRCWCSPTTAWRRCPRCGQHL